MHRFRSERLVAYAVLCSVALVVAVAAAQPGLVAFAAPFAVALVAGLAGARQHAPPISVSVTLDRPEVNEGERVVATIELTCDEPVPRCEIGLRLPAQLVLVEGAACQPVTLVAGEPTVVTLTLEPRRWGNFVIGPLAARVSDPGGLFSWEGGIGGEAALRVLPHREALRHLVRPRAVGSAAGEQISRLRGEGLELADIRRYVTGDRARSINWRVSARQRKLHVNEQHPDRNTDVILLLDTFSEEGLGQTVRIAWALVDAYLGRRDRVGLIGFGGVASWIEPSGGRRQREILTAALEDMDAFRSYAWKSIDVIPQRMLPARCLVIAVSPLNDERMTLAVATLRARGLDVGVIEVPTEALDDPVAAGTWSESAARRLYEMEREMARDRLMARGIAVTPWRAESGVESCLALMEACRRNLRSGVRV